MAPRRGSQVPTFSTVGDYAWTDGDYAVDVFGGYGIRFYESQALEMRTFLARKADGSFAATTIAISKPRQNGKSFAARFYAIWMAAIEGKRVLYSAHHGKTVRKMFKEIRNFLERNPDWYSMLKPNGKGIYAVIGYEGIYFVDEDGVDAGLIEFQTRTNSGARGETYQVIIVDEAQELTDEQLEAIKPTTFAASDVDEANSDPQMIYIGTPPGPKCPGTVFRDWHDRAHESGDIWWMEWAVEDVPDMTDVEAVIELVYMTNPAMGYRIKESTMRDAIATMRADGFARECLGWWSKTVKVAVDHPIAAEDWEACKVDVPPEKGGLVYAVKFSPDGSTGTMAVCLAPDDGVPFVEVVDTRSMRRGIRWFCDFLIDREDIAEAFVIDGKGNAQAVNDRLVEAGVDEDMIVRPSTIDAIAAYASFVDATVPQGVDEDAPGYERAAAPRGVSHAGQPMLADSATLSTRRRIGTGGGFGFQSNDNADATLVDACALAYWCAMSIRRNPRTEMRIG